MNFEFINTPLFYILQSIICIFMEGSQNKISSERTLEGNPRSLRNLAGLRKFKTPFLMEVSNTSFS